MRPNSLFLILIVLVFGTACDNEIVERAADFEFKATDKDSNEINLSLMVRYRLKTRLDKKALDKYGRHYKDSLLLPVISSIAERVLKDYSAGEIYNYKREEIEQKFSEQTKTKFADAELELTNFLIKSVGLSDTLMRRLEKEHIVRFEQAMNNCKKETKAAITDTRPNDPMAFYEFIVKNMKYKGVLNLSEFGGNLNRGDSVAIEYACEDPIFHRIKK